MYEHTFENLEELLLNKIGFIKDLDQYNDEMIVVVDGKDITVSINYKYPSD